jgi:pseudomonalisin
MLRTLRIFLLFISSVALLGLVSRAQTAQNRIHEVIDEQNVVTLTGNTHPLVLPENDRGPIAPETQLNRMVLVLQTSPARQADLDTLTEAQQDPNSPGYHHWLTPEEYGARFGASTGDLAKITAWLQSHGFRVEPPQAGRNAIIFSGSAEQVADTFHTEIHAYKIGAQTHIANSQDPQIPSALAPVVAGVLSLHDFRRVSATQAVRQVANPENTQGSAHYLFPADFATIYNLSPLYAAGANGKGTTIAIVGRSAINLSDVSSFRATAGLPAGLPTVVLAGANPGKVSGDQDEATLDVEWAGGTAPGAAIDYVLAASTASTDGVDIAAQYIVNHKTAQIMSTSFGNCESHMGSAELAFYNSLWQQAAAEGISSFVSSGDSGAAGCESGSSTRGSKAAVNGLCSSPYVTCVGGTEFNEGSAAAKYWTSYNSTGNRSALGYIPEKVWNESAGNGGSGLWSSGGGISGVYPQPVWQKGVPGAVSNGMRAVPDVALTAAAHDGYLVCENGNWYVFSGTSAASPSFAGIMALVVQARKGIGQGNANPILYSLLSANTNPFHATPSGNNTVPGVNGHIASGAAYNLATGLGSVDAHALVSAWPTPAVKQPATITVSGPAKVTVVQARTETFAVTVTTGGSFTGTITLAISGLPTGITASWSTASLTAKGSTTQTVNLTLKATKDAALKLATATITASGDGLHAQSTTGIQVAASPAIRPAETARSADQNVME